MIEAIRIQIYNELNQRIMNQGIDEVARDFLTKNLFRTDQFGSLKLIPIMGYVVLDIPTSKRPNPVFKDPEIFDNKKDAVAYARELYESAEDEFIDEVCFEGIIGFQPLTNKNRKLSDDLPKSVELLFEDSIERVTNKIKEFISKFEDTNYLLFINMQTSMKHKKIFFSV